MALDLKSTFGINNINLSGIGSGVKILGIFLLIAIVIGIVLFIVLNRKQYTKNIKVFMEVNGFTRQTMATKAKEFVIPGTNIRVFKLKSGLIIPRPTILTATNEYWFFVRNDNEWINFSITNMNKELKEMKIQYDHTDMRYASNSLRKLMKDDYNKGDWLKQWGPYIAFGILIVLLCIGFYFIAVKLGDVAGQLAATQAENTKLVQIISKILEFKGEGLTPA
jgi:hypothetical protein